MVGFNVFILFKNQYGGKLFIKMSTITAVEEKKTSSIGDNYCTITVQDGSKYLVKEDVEKVINKIADNVLRPAEKAA